MLNEAEDSLLLQVTSILRDPRGYAMIRQNRSELARRVDDQGKAVTAINNAVTAKKAEIEGASEADKPGFQEELTKLETEQKAQVDQQEVMLDALVTLDDMMISNRPGLGTAAFAKDVDTVLAQREKDHGELESGQEAHQRVTDIFKDMARGSGSARYQANHPTTEIGESDSAGNKVLTDGDKTTMRDLSAQDRTGDQAARIDAMKARTAAAQAFHSSDAELLTSYHTEGALQQFAKGALQSAVSTWERSALKQVAEAGAQFGQAEKESYGMLQKTLGKIQQLVEQLINLQKL